ncbi:uncharacterized protein M421DRAFT_212287 [Didymella exigua CBS 183.55]|uniref:Uncharacterized protein n=1 Tax=Didymella exigua CBS 183.55 TaxID=1150837 RepID=A0A6A5RJP1_9PLEO|nr:uncharacterized protein M421DRAFT_212287 [Didymella exigua CBS 183.55]KAF1926636.1 hypothetical protein M421DRAFT_212287 [Didymella exigua CBS 183.55]
MVHGTLSTGTFLLVPLIPWLRLRFQHGLYCVQIESSARAPARARPFRRLFEELASRVARRLSPLGLTCRVSRHQCPPCQAEASGRCQQTWSSNPYRELCSTAGSGL